MWRCEQYKLKVLVATLIAIVCNHIGVTTFEVRRAAKRPLLDGSYELFVVVAARDALRVIE